MTGKEFKLMEECDINHIDYVSKSLYHTFMQYLESNHKNMDLSLLVDGFSNQYSCKMEIKKIGEQYNIDID